ncbi:YARHG domain-containing protein [Clostridium sp.]|uniref:YARHG domain-containing protein n=1 Tax=Clostridium sp. TaxID=1506 RepID=UPI00263A0B1C|nr:YARHG domain-containing protein [Clostridium sp.]
MKKSIISCIICSLISFTLISCSGLTISFNSDDKSTTKETKQDQNTESKSDAVSDKTTESESKKDASLDDKSDTNAKTNADENKQSQLPDDKSNVTININGDTKPEKKDVIIIRDPIPTNTAHGSFIFYNSDSSYLTKSQISSLSNIELGIARNEIYARHGYIFSLEQFRTYFYAQSWYKPITKNVSLNNIETYNVELLKAEEDRRGIKWN